MDTVRNTVSKDRYHFNQVKHLVQSKIKSAYNNYLADILGVGSEKGGGGENTGFTSKKLFSLVKNSSQDNQGIYWLKDSSDNMLYSENIKKADLLNKLCTQTIQDTRYKNFYFPSVSVGQITLAT